MVGHVPPHRPSRIDAAAGALCCESRLPFGQRGHGGAEGFVEPFGCPGL